MRFLLVDKDDGYAGRLADMIAACCPPGVTVDRTADTTKATDMIQSRFYDVCFLEYELEHPADGLDVLRLNHRTSSLTAFVVLTGHANKEAAFEALTQGATDYLIKERVTDFEVAKCISYSVYLKRREVAYQTEALKDSLTGLGNRALFDEQLKQAALRAERDLEKLGLLIIDLDGFKRLNDKHGHQFGDKVLQQVAERIVNETRASDVQARIGGDEFAAILIRPKSAEHIQMVAEKLENALAKVPYNIDGTVIKMGASVGTAVLPDDGRDLEHLFNTADQRMYARKDVKRAAFRQSRDYMDAVLR